ncbi:alpha/beta hydrolase family protein [Larkinella soli]|uniref:alpha/beta hydrolase family protein n=1 Tax=Larkinella soli TaxID=1770527 RepID=UPI000FFC886A|nr:alpha/beta hydrolase [Larkinella soli]
MTTFHPTSVRFFRRVLLSGFTGFILLACIPVFGQPSVYTQLPSQPLPYRSLDVRYPNPTDASVQLAGTLTLPEGKGPFPAVLLISGSGQSERDMPFYGHKMFLVLADQLTRHGFAVLRFDDRGAGQSTPGSKPLRELTDADFDADAQAGVQFLRSRAEVDPGRIGLLGHSQGTGTALNLANRPPREIAFLVLLAAAAPTMSKGEIVAGQLLVKLKLKGFSETATQAARRFIGEALGIVREEGDAVKRKEALTRLAARELAQVPAAEQPGWKEEMQVRVQDLSNELFHQDALQPHPDQLTTVTCPVLAMNGEKDILIPAETAVRRLKESLRAGTNRDYQVELLPGLNHMFQATPTGFMEEGKDLPETFSAPALRLLVTWLADHFSTPLSH